MCAASSSASNGVLKTNANSLDRRSDLQPASPVASSSPSCRGLVATARDVTAGRTDSGVMLCCGRITADVDRRFCLRHVIVTPPDGPGRTETRVRPVCREKSGARGRRPAVQAPQHTISRWLRTITGRVVAHPALRERVRLFFIVRTRLRPSYTRYYTPSVRFIYGLSNHSRVCSVRTHT